MNVLRGVVDEVAVSVHVDVGCGQGRAALAGETELTLAPHTNYSIHHTLGRHNGGCKCALESY